MADTEALLNALTLKEKATLTAGGNMFSTAPIERLGIPEVNVTDGPNGARGQAYPGIAGDPSTCIPCGSALGATWDPELVERLGRLVGAECLDRGCRGLLAPTVNLHRSPLAGRNFECFSEDPLLSGRLAAAYIRGVQSQGVFATVKHFVGNEAEYERNSISSVVDERALRELYLVPFELAVREGGVLAVMTAYNRLNGRWLTEQPRLLTELLRREWGFEGLVMTDWFAVADSSTSLAAGLDLEMPGPGRALGDGIAALVEDGTVQGEDLSGAVRHLLVALDRCGALDAPAPPADPKDLPPGDRELIRRAAVEASVLLHNDGILPFEVGTLRRVAVVGDHAATPRIQGGGSARVVERPVTSPLDALTSVLGPGVEVAYARGCEADRSGTLVGRSVLRAPDGFETEVFEGPELSGDIVHRGTLEELRLLVYNATAQGYPEGDWSMRVRGTVVPAESGLFELALAQSGRARVLVDGKVVLDGFEDPPPPGGSDFFGFASQELVGTVELVAGSPVEVMVEYATVEARLAGVRVGFRTVDTDGLLESAAEAAEAADAAVVFVGTTHEWETEGRDRTTMALPGRQDELVRRIAAANRRTVVVVNAGAPVDLSWADEVGAVVQCWFGGEEMAAAVADILVGTSEPGGRLPTTVPLRVEHSPSHDNFPGENGELRYGEGLFMGYRGFEHRCIEPRYAFGHGLGYSRFELDEPVASSGTFTPGDELRVAVEVRNTGSRAGSEVVQCYVAPRAPRLPRPPKELKAFARVHLEPGASTVVELRLDDRSFAYWDPGQADWDAVAARFTQTSPQRVEQDRRSPGWQVDAGRYDILVGRSSADITGRLPVEVVHP
jgi:beta-glucosidase